jgi:hypothetical protein
MDPRRLSRIPKIVEKMIRLFGHCHIAEDLLIFIDNSDDLKEVISILYQQYPNREPLYNDILNVLRSQHFEQVLKTILSYTEMFKLFCGIDPIININMVPVDEMIRIRNDLLKQDICTYESSMLVTAIMAYKLTTNINPHIFTLSNNKNGTQYLLGQNNCTLFQYVRMWLPLIDNEKLVKLNVLNTIGQHQIGSDLWYHSLSHFLLFTYSTVSFNIIKNANEAYKCIHKIIKIKKFFVDHNLVSLDELLICGEIHEELKQNIINIDPIYKNKKEKIDMIKKDALLQIKDHLQQNIVKENNF